MLLCARCGASNAEAAPLCGNCGASLREQFDTPSAVVNVPGLPFAHNVEEKAALSIDELPTAHVPSMPKPADIAPPTPLPFGQAFPMEIASDAVAQAQTAPEITVIAPSSQLAFTPQVSELASDPGMAPLDIADYPTRTGVPVPPVSTSTASDSNTPPARLGKLSLPSRPKTGAPPSQPGINTPPSQPSINPPSQPNLGQQPMSRPPSQAGIVPQPAPGGGPQGRSGPPSQAGIYPMNVQPGVSGPPPANARPLSEPGFAPQPSQAGGNWRGPGGEGQYQGPGSAPAQLGNVFPGAPADSPRGALSQGGAAPSQDLNRLVLPLPLWARVGGPTVGALLLLGLIFLNPDWATGAMVASIVAITLAILLGIAAGVRVALGMLQATNQRRRAQLISIALLMLLLLLFSGLGLSQQNGLHLAQGRYLESQQNWPLAIKEYQEGGERSSFSLDVARTYNEWGEAQMSQQQFEGAVTSFSIVIEDYQGASAEFTRAKTQIVSAYLNWGEQASQQQDYAGATAHYNDLLSLIFCRGNDCMKQASARDATAYYHLAEQQLAHQQYKQAVDAYQTLKLRFPQAPEVAQTHAHYAQALWGLGQQQLSSSCSDALGNYRLLATLFADTSEGQQAASALRQPVPVQGHFTQSVPGAPYHPTAYLVQGLVAGMQQYQFPALLAHAPVAPIQSDGSFTFAPIPQGTYELVWSSDSALHYYYAYNGKQVLYVAQVGPLCAFNYGDINQAIPTR